MPAPIALFVYNRPEHTRLTIEHLLQCEGVADSPVYVFSDGPKGPGDAAAVAQVRKVVRETFGGPIRLTEREQNIGLARSIIDGVTRMCERHGRAIVLEDDLVVSPRFLSYMNAALEKYAEEKRVMQVSGYMFPVNAFKERQAAMVLPLTTSWGWATWQRAWGCFDDRARGWEQLYTDLQQRDRFNLGGAFDYFSMLEKQMQGRSNSWAIRWYWCVFKHKGLAAFPPVTLVKNIGFDGSGTHGWRNARRSLGDAAHMTADCTFPDEPTVDKADFEEVKAALGTVGKGFVFSRLVQILRSLLKYGTRYFGTRHG